MATITTDTYLDGGTARTAGETWTINGCTLTIRTDTRWHANAPASMTGSLGALTISSALGGSIKVDATKVRWMAFDTGLGTVPAIGTTITQGGVSGYLLGVWADLQSAPVAVGGVMPVSGFLKFREVTGGTFSAGALSGILANASSPDVTGWIEIAKDAASNFSGSVLGDGIVFQGGWFYLDNTNGSRGQQIQVPTNGGGAETHICGVQIETAPGSGVFEWYPAASATLGSALWKNTVLGTDSRAKIVETVGNGVVRIGSDGTNNIGYLPPAGCKVRIPNIFGRTCTTAARAVNARPGVNTRPNIGGGNFLINNAHLDYSFDNNSYNTRIHDSALDVNGLIFQSLSYPLDIDNVCLSGFVTSGVNAKLRLQDATSGSFTNVTMLSEINGLNSPLMLRYLSNCTVSNIKVIVGGVRSSATAGILYSGLSNCTVSNSSVVGGQVTISNCLNSTFSGLDYIDRSLGTTTTGQAQSALIFGSNNNVTFSGLTFGNGGTIADVHCKNAIFQSSGFNTGFKIRNCGTRAAPLNTGSTSTIYPATLWSFNASASYEDTIKIQRVYVTNVITAMANPITAMKNLVVEDVYFQYTLQLTPFGYGGIWRKFTSSSNSSATTTANIGIHFTDYFTSNTTGEIKWYGQQPTSNTAGQNYIVATPSQGTGYVPSGPGISIDTVGDYVFSESDWIKGHTGFRNAAPTAGGSWGAYVTVYYDLDTGSGFSGTWKVVNGTNLSAETISPAGFRIRLKMLAVNNTSLNTSDFRTYIIPTTTSIQAQTDNLYPLDTNTLSFTGLAVGSEVRCYVGTDPATATEIGGTEATGGSTFSFQHSSGGQAGYIAILAMGYQPIRIPYTYKSVDDSILIQPVIDRNYNNPV